MQKRLMPIDVFREYDIRGIVDQEFYTDQIYDLAKAIIYFFLQRNPHLKTVAVAIDGRTHSPLIAQLMMQAVTDSNVNVVLLDVCPSPVLYFAMHTIAVDAGLMVTASHNPKEYNGIKLMLGTETISGEEIQEIYRLYKIGSTVDTQQKGKITSHHIIPAYVDWLVDHFQHVSNRSMPIVIDCGNGAGGAVIPLLVDRMRWKDVQLLYTEVDGTYPHHEADPVKLVNMQDVARKMKETRSIAGVGLDGDADRMAVMTTSEHLVSGDLLLGLFASYIAADHHDMVVVCDIKSSAALLTHLKNIGITVIIAPSGHSIIKKEMKKHKALLGGELSCHFFFHDRYFGYDDGIYALLRLCELLIHHSDLDAQLQVYPRLYSSPEFRIPCDEIKKQLIVQTVRNVFESRMDIQHIVSIDGVRVTMPYGWGLLRASNTQPMLSLRFEGETQEGLTKITYDFIDVLSQFYDAEYLTEVLLQATV